MNEVEKLVSSAPPGQADREQLGEQDAAGEQRDEASRPSSGSPASATAQPTTTAAPAAITTSTRAFT